MYEQNREPLPDGDASIVFAQQLAAMRTDAAKVPARLTHETVVRWADPGNQPHFAAMARRLLLPGSGIIGVANLQQLVALAGEGHACLLCLNHRSNLDVPTLQALLEDQQRGELFRQIIWIAGRKLEEDVGMTRMLVQCFNRVIVSPHGWFDSPHCEEDIHEARCINIAAERAVSILRHQGWVFALFPTGTRIRRHDPSTRQAIEETDSYLKMFQYLVLCNIDGCTMPVTKDRDLTHETPKLDRVLYSFGPVLRTEQFRVAAAKRFTESDQRAATAQAMMQAIGALAPANSREDR